MTKLKSTDITRDKPIENAVDIHTCPYTDLLLT